MTILDAELAITLVRDFRESTDPRASNELPRGVDRLSGDFNNGVYRVTSEHGRCCVKVYRSDHRQRGDREWRALSFLQDHGCSFAPRPHERQQVEGTTVTTMEYLEGSHLRGGSLTREQVGRINAQVRRP